MNGALSRRVGSVMPHPEATRHRPNPPNERHAGNHSRWGQVVSQAVPQALHHIFAQELASLLDTVLAGEAVPDRATAERLVRVLGAISHVHQRHIVDGHGRCELFLEYRPPMVAPVAAPHRVFGTCGIELLPPPITKPRSHGTRRPACNICGFTGRAVSTDVQMDGKGCRSCRMRPCRTLNRTRLPGFHLPDNGTPLTSETVTSR